MAIPPAKNQKVNVLEKILGDKFDTQPGSIGTVTVSHNEIVQAEISHYKSVPSIKLSEKPLPWWNLHQHSFPNLAKMAQRYLGIVATSTPSGNIVNAKRSALCPENVNKLVFLHEHLPPIHLNHKRTISKCNCKNCKTCLTD